jgi:cytochrome c oxidase assembly factor CtaG
MNAQPQMHRARQPWQSPFKNPEGGHLDSSWLNLATDWDIPPAITGTLVAVGFIYVRGWLALRQSRPGQIPTWRLFAFLGGLFAIFVAVSSSLDTYSETLLFMHMAQHLVLMSIAPPLIVLGYPVVPMLRGLPRVIVRQIGGPIFRSSIIHSLQEVFSKLPFAWLAMNLTYIGWHIPKAYEFALSSENWHNLEHFCFFATSLIFWWPIVRPWPAQRRLNSWMIIPYLLTSDFVNTGLSAFLCFSGRLLYPSYGAVERPFGIDALKDQVAAGAFMWVFGSLIFLVPAVCLTTRFLANDRLMNEKALLERARVLAG